MDFRSYGLRKELLQALEQHGFDTPMEVQDCVLSEDWNHDLIVRAKTGSGKTLAFLLPLMQEMKIGEKVPQILILAPTRELAQQTAEESEFLGKFLKVKTASLVGGMDIYPQLRTLSHGVAVIAGTPGRVRDHIQRGSLKTDEIHSVVLDEGDLMLDMGFREELEAILDSLPEGRRWLFSATMPLEVRDLANRYLDEPLTLSINEEGEQHEDILHKVYKIPSKKRFEGLVDILLWEHPSRSLVFCHTKLESIEIAQRLQDHGFSAAALQGDMTQDERNAVLASFKSGSIPCLVATNVAARGLDIEGVSHVIQLGLPDDRETFIHRSGRTGRAGHEGVNLVLLSPAEFGRFREMLKGTEIKTEWLDIPGIDKIRASWRDSAEQDIFAAPVDSFFSECVKWADDLIKRAEPKILIAKLLAVLSAKNKGYDLANELKHELERKIRKSSQSQGKHSGKIKSDKPKGVFKRFRSSKLQTTGNILNAVCTSLKVDKSEVGAIRINDKYVLVELMANAAEALENDKPDFSRFGLFHEEDNGNNAKNRNSNRNNNRNRNRRNNRSNRGN